MKLLVISCLLCFSTSIFSRGVLPSLKGQDVCWLGVDFSIGKFVGEAGFTDAPKIKEEYMPAWNSSLITNRRIDILEKGLKMNSLSFNTDNTRTQNEKIEMDEYIQEKPHDIDGFDIAKLLERYDYSEINQNICISIVVESFDKLAGLGEVWMVFNFRDKNVKFMKKLDLKPAGVGFKRYWLTVLTEAIIVTDNRHKRWYKGKD